MILQIVTGQKLQEPGIIDKRDARRRDSSPRRRFLTKGLSALLLSSAVFEATGDIVYVTLMERTFDLGGGAAAVGVFLVLQAAAQLFLGPMIGSLTDILGSRRAAVFGLVALASLSLGLVYTTSIWVVYLIALHITIARLFVITSRVPLITKLSSRAGYLGANSAISVLEGFGLLLGPAIAAALILIWREPTLPFLVASVLFLGAAVPMVVRINYVERARVGTRISVMVEVKRGWKHIVTHRPIWEVLVCLTISGLTFGAAMPMLTLLARQVGLGAEGSGILVAALGLGWLLGPFAAGPLIRRLSYTQALIVAGLATPLTAAALGYLSSVMSILFALTISAFAAAALQVIVTTIVQRLTPEEIQGSVMGTQRALSGLIWIISALFVTIALAITPPEMDPRTLFYPLGALGALMVLACWSFGRRTLSGIMEGVASRIE